MRQLSQLNYFGTSLDRAGHYYRIISGNNLYYMSSEAERKLPFNPEGLICNQRNGTVNMITINGLRIIAIAGSPCDTRPGGKSVFWADHSTTFWELITAIRSIPYAKRIIENMPFEVKLPNVVEPPQTETETES